MPVYLVSQLYYLIIIFYGGFKTTLTRNNVYKRKGLAFLAGIEKEYF